jgi:peptide/nickel transport system permease protein
MIIDGINAFPLIVLIIAIVAVTGPGVIGLLTAILLTNWARYARVARARAVMVSKAEYVQSLSLLGYSRTRIVFRHVVPNTWTETRAYALSDFVVIVISVAGLSFLGLGIRPPQAEWGAMISEGRLYLQEAWWMIAFPGIALSVVATGVALLADSRSSVAADSMKALA